MNRNKREQLILDAAVKIFRRQGFATTTVSEIIDEADVARGTFYLYFKNKDETVLRIIDRYFEDILLALSKMNGSECNAEKIRISSTSLIMSLTSLPHWTLFVLKEVGSYKPEFEARIQVLYDQIMRLITASLENACQLGLLKEANYKVTSHILLGSVRQMAIHVAQEGVIEIEPYISGTISLMLRGLLPNVALTEQLAPVANMENNLPRSNLAIH